MKIIMSLALSAITLAGLVYGSGPLNVPADEIILKVKEMNLEVSLKRNEDDTLGVKVMRDGVEVIIPAKELALIKVPNLMKARIIVHVPHGGELPEGFMAKAGFILSIDYGGFSEHGIDEPDKSVSVYSRARLHISDRLTEIERAIPLGDFKNKWDLYSKVPNEAEVSNGSEDSIDCPYDH